MKVLDFGLAKALDPVAVSGSAVMNSPTLTARATQLGVILGKATALLQKEMSRAAWHWRPAISVDYGSIALLWHG